MYIMLLDYEGGHTYFYGSEEEAIEYFNNNDEYWKLFIGNDTLEKNGEQQ